MRFSPRQIVVKYTVGLTPPENVDPLKGLCRALRRVPIAKGRCGHHPGADVEPLAILKAE